MTALQVLKKARALLRRSKWIQGESARTRNGKAVDAEHPKAVAFCAGGAMLRVCRGYSPESDQARWLLQDVLTWRDVGTTIIEDWNDQPSRTKAQVLAAFDKAIKLAEKETA